MGRVQDILECLFCCLLSGGKSRFVRHLQSKTQTAAALQNPIVDANSEPRLNTNLQEDYPKKLFVFMQFVLHYLACHLSFVTTLQNVGRDAGRQIYLWLVDSSLCMGPQIELFQNFHKCAYYAYYAL